MVRKKKVKRKVRLLPIFWIFGLFAYIGSSIFITSVNSNLATEISLQEEEIKKLQENVNLLSHQINTLSSRERIVAIVKDSGLDANPDRVVNVAGR